MSCLSAPAATARRDRRRSPISLDLLHLLNLNCAIIRLRSPPENQRPAQWFLHSGREPRAEPTPYRHNTTSAGLGTSSTMALSKSDRMIILLVINGIFFVVELCVGTSLGS